MIRTEYTNLKAQPQISADLARRIQPGEDILITIEPSHNQKHYTMPKKKFKVEAKTVTYCYIEVEADSKEEAFALATEIDGGDFITDDENGYFELLHEDYTTEVK